MQTKEVTSEAEFFSACARLRPGDEILLSPKGDVSFLQKKRGNGLQSASFFAGILRCMKNPLTFNPTGFGENTLIKVTCFEWT